MAYLQVKNRAVSALAADITATATSLTVTTDEGAKFPQPGNGFNITIENEILKCTARTTDTLTVTRAQEGTTAVAHNAGKSVELHITAGVLESRTTWTSGKLLEGAGVGIDPTEVDMPAADYPMKQKPAITRWVIPGWFSIGSQSNIAATAGRIYYIPIFVEEATTYIRIGVNVGTAVAGTADLRIFNWGAGLPTSLVLSAGTVDTGTTGAKEITISQTLNRGYYFLAVRCSAAPSLYGLSYAIPPVSGINDSLAVQPKLVIPYVAAAYADPAPAPTALTTQNYAFVMLREN